MLPIYLANFSLQNLVANGWGASGFYQVPHLQQLFANELCISSFKKESKKTKYVFPHPVHCLINSKNKGAVVSTIRCIIQIVGLDFVSASCISFLEFMKKSFILQGNWNEFVPLPYLGNIQLNLFDQQHYLFCPFHKLPNYLLCSFQFLDVLFDKSCLKQLLVLTFMNY